MSISASMLPEFDQEMANTRKALERVSDDVFDWTPHQKSLSMQDLVSHLANLPTWTAITIREDGFDMAPPDGEEPPSLPKMRSTEEALASFDANVASAREILAGASDAVMMEDWSLRDGDEIAFTMPKVAVMRSFILNHMIHHRGQLSVYLRLNDLPVPAIYGPSADEEA